MKKKQQPLDRIETICDETGAQVTITRASKLWIGVVRTPDGRQTQHQSPLDQAQLFDDILHSLERMTEG